MNAICRERQTTPVMSIIVCTLPRSGSWLLCDGLWRTGVAGRPQEYLRPDWYERFRQVGHVAFENRLHQRAPWHQPAAARPLPVDQRRVRSFIDNIVEIAATDNGVCALKCHWFQAETFMRALGDGAEPAPLHDVFPGTRYVRLRRRDKTRQAISWFRAMQSHQWWAQSTSQAAAVPAYDADRITTLRDQLAHLERAWDAYFERWDQAVITLNYEELATDYKGTLRRLLARLGLDSPGLIIPSPRLERQADTVSLSWATRLSVHRPDAHTGPGRRAPTVKKERTMRRSVIIVDNFYANPEAVRDYARKQDYRHPYQPDADVMAGRRRATWMTSPFMAAHACPFKSSEELIERLEALTGDRIDREHWDRGFPLTAEGKPAPDHRRHHRSCLWNCSFHVKPETGQELGQGVHNHVTDSWNGVGEWGWAGLLYLNEDAPLRGGLKLWRNIDPAHNYDWMTPKEQWELIDDLGNVPNRLLLCRGSLPHSGARGWGSTVEDGRLYQTFFFRVLPTPPDDGVLAPV